MIELTMSVPYILSIMLFKSATDVYVFVLMDEYKTENNTQPSTKPRMKLNRKPNQNSLRVERPLKLK